MLEPKVLAIGASIGFVLSFFTGLLSGASFPIVLLRAFLMAVLSGVLVAFVRGVVRKFIPELLGDFRVEPGVEENSGNVVNITIDDTANDAVSFGDSGDRNNEGMIPDFLEPSVGSRNEQATFMPETSEKPESAPVRQDSKTSPRDQTPSGAPSGAKEQHSVDGLDVLPDLQDFVPQKGFDQDEAEAEEIEPVIHTGLTASAFTASDMQGSSVEAETMAKAIRTILSRDN